MGVQKIRKWCTKTTDGTSEDGGLRMSWETRISLVKSYIEGIEWSECKNGWVDVILNNKSIIIPS